MARVIRSLIELEVTDEGGSPEQESVLTPVPCSGIDTLRLATGLSWEARWRRDPPWEGQSLDPWRQRRMAELSPPPSLS